MGVFRKRVIPGNERVTTVVVTDPDAWGVHMAGLGLYTNTASPAAAGVTDANAVDGYVRGDAGYGVNRALNFLAGPLQRFVGPTAPIISPSGAQLGIGAGVSGQPGLPSTGQDGSAGTALAWMSYSPLGRMGMGG